MSKPVDNSNAQEEKCSWPSARDVFLFISVVFTLTMAFLIVWPIKHRTAPVHEVRVSLQIPCDSVTIEHVLRENDAQIARLIDDLDQQSRELYDKYELLLKSQETSADFLRLVSCVVAFVCALLGFLGYKTIKDIESKAKSLANTTAKEYTEKHLETEVETQLREIIGNATAAKLLREQMMSDLISTYFKPMDERLCRLEQIQPTGSESDQEAETDSLDNAFSHGNSEIDELNKTEGENNE